MGGGAASSWLWPLLPPSTPGALGGQPAGVAGKTIQVASTARFPGSQPDPGLCAATASPRKRGGAWDLERTGGVPSVPPAHVVHTRGPSRVRGRAELPRPGRCPELASQHQRPLQAPTGRDEGERLLPRSVWPGAGVSAGKVAGRPWPMAASPQSVAATRGGVSAARQMLCGAAHRHLRTDRVEGAVPASTPPPREPGHGNGGSHGEHVWPWCEEGALLPL